ncbi:MAG: M35 family metallo-endopeptidase, partial [Limisphaerales bacterium]
PAPAPAPAGPVLALSACAGQNAKDAAAAETLMGQWLTKAITDLDGFVGAPADAAHAKTAAALMVHFHRSDADLGAAVMDRLKLVQAAFDKGSGSQCADATNPNCQMGADGFAAPKAGSVGLCPLYFTEPVETQANTLLHEGMHLHGAAHAIPDRAYSHARQYAILTPEEAFDNADSFSNLVEDLVLGAGSAVKGAAAPPADMIVGCDPTQQDQAGRALGLVQKWMDPAFEAVSDPALSSQALVQGEVTRHLGDATQPTLDKAKVAYAHIGMAVTASMSLTCDAAGPDCPSGEPVRADMAKGVVRFCPDWFALSKDELRAEFLFDELLQERAKIHAVDSPSYVSLARTLFGISFAAPPAIPVRPPPPPAPAPATP